MSRWTAAWLLLLNFVLETPAQTQEERQATTRWLQALQAGDGGFRSSPTVPNRGSLRATSAALRALHRWGGEPRSPAAAIQFVERCWDKSTGTFGDRPGSSGDAILTAVGLMAVRELDLPIDRFRDAAIRALAQKARDFEEIRMAAAGMEAAGKVDSDASRVWIENLRKRANPDGSFGSGIQKPRATASSIVTILRLGGHKIDRTTILDLLNTGQNPDGGFGHDETLGSDLETTYRVMRCYHMLQARPARAEALRQWVGSCRNADGGYGIRPGQPSQVGATYFAVMVLDWLSAR